MNSSFQTPVLKILLADDDSDDRFFFAKALRGLDIRTKLVTVCDGEELMTYLADHSNNPPDILFLDLNMPRKSGSECLMEIKAHSKIKSLPVVVHSTAFNKMLEEVLHMQGAHYYLKKCEFAELRKNLEYLIPMMVERGFERPSKDEFVLNMVLA